MENAVLYTQFKECIEKEDISSLDVFKNPHFLDGLKEEEKASLAKLFLRRGEEILFERAAQGLEAIVEPVNEAFSFAERLSPNQAEMLARQGACHFRLGRLLQEDRHYLLALEKFENAERANPQFFNTHLPYLHLHASCLVAIGKKWQEETFFSGALALFSRFEGLVKKGATSELPLYDLYWDWGEAWILLGKCSEEPSDFHAGIEKFEKAKSLGCNLPHFQIDFGDALYEYAVMKGSLVHLEAAITLFKQALVVVTHPENLQPIAYKKGWSVFAKAMKKKALMTMAFADMQAAEAVFQETITAIPDYASLWLDWGELLLRFGWAKKNMALLEASLEKLTSSKMKECNPLMVSALIGEGLMALGLYLDDFSIIKDGQTRIEDACRISPDFLELQYASGFGYLVKGVYFENEAEFNQAACLFEKAIQSHPTKIHLWAGLYQTYFSWGTFSKNEFVLRKALPAIERILELSPETAHYWSEAGLLLLRLASLSEEKENLLELAITKFDHAIQLQSEAVELEWVYHMATCHDHLGTLRGDESAYEKAIELYSNLLEKVPNALDVRFSLAQTLSHLGELTGECEFLYRSIDLFESVDKKLEEEDIFLAEWGYTLLNLSTLIYDPLHVEEAERLLSRAEEKLIAAAELGNAEVFYSLACLYSISKHLDEAYNYFVKADREDFLPPLADLENDEWLENLRQTQIFQDYLNMRRRHDG